MEEPVRLASFNVENLFSRAKALNRDQWLDNVGDDPADWTDGRRALEYYGELNGLFRKSSYSAADKARMVVLLTALGLAASDESSFVILRKNRGTLLKRPQGGGIQIVADGRDDWIGWLELKKEAVNEVATQNTARVLDLLQADVTVVVEAEDRISLCRFNEQVLKLVGGALFDQIMLIDGNDERGIDVGLMVRGGVTIDFVRSHVDDRDGSTKVFSRDCAEFHLRAGGSGLVVLANHLKSKGYGPPAQSNAKRKAQATRLRAIYDALRTQGIDRIAIAGDFNDTLTSAPLAPLVGAGSDLKDISAHATFNDGGRPGTYGTGAASNKIDHILLSPALWAKVTGGGIERRGVWTASHKWTVLPELTKEAEAASDHAAIWVDLNL
jgi:endonuclease/exonuclease/phosphatase family metal-dependent hydrolase